MQSAGGAPPQSSMNASGAHLVKAAHPAVRQYRSTQRAAAERHAKARAGDQPRQTPVVVAQLRVGRVAVAGDRRRQPRAGTQQPARHEHPLQAHDTPRRRQHRSQQQQQPKQQKLQRGAASRCRHVSCCRGWGPPYGLARSRCRTNRRYRLRHRRAP